jgi:uncharacterized protein YbcC (UPF0753/DUF2309 family)
VNDSHPIEPAHTLREPPVDRLRASIDRAAAMLPAQGPLAVFAYLNRLQSLEHCDFEKAVVVGGQVYGCHAYWPEDHYHRERGRRRILSEDIQAELIDDLGDDADIFLGFLGTRYQLRLAMLEQPLRLTPTHELEWLITESDVLRGSHDDDPLWRACLGGVRGAPLPHTPPPTPLRHRDAILAAGGGDSDALVHEFLSRYAAAFCDQGLAARPLPTRDAGFFGGFLELYGARGGSPEPWLRGLRAEIDRHVSSGLGAYDSIRTSLDDLGVPEREQETYLTETLLALKGWAGMVWQMEVRGDRVPLPAPPGSLEGFLAVRLLLDRLAITHVARESLGWTGPLSELRALLATLIPNEPTLTSEQRAFQIFELARHRGWKPESLRGLPVAQWATLVREVEAFSNVERRRILHRAYERRYRMLALDALAAHRRSRAAASPVSDPAFQVITCIDDREESFRRHLEEVEPSCETFGAAGFFGVAMYFRGVADAHDTPLCPIDVTPQHTVREHVALTFADSERVRRQTRQAIGTVTHRFHVGSRTFIGGLVAAVFGSLASLPLVIRILFPRMAAHLRKWFARFVAPPPVTYLELERTEDPPGRDPGHVGYSLDEMTTIVGKLLRDVGLTKRFAPLVVVLGHGSSSQNNPHESAYNCGACAGGRGGPNARSFAQMANDPRVRAALASQGLVIPATTWFLSGEHDTCDESVALHDLERLPSIHANDFQVLRTAVNEARRRNAQERCRRFYSADVNISGEAAIRHVEARAADLSQVRPEYKHPNALCLVGRRSISRGLFLDRRAFLQSYDPAQDDEEFTILTRILQAVVPVCAGINLEYYFSTVDPVGWGSGNKLSHNIAALVGVMDGAASDLRPGLTRQMIEIHEPMRLLFVIETTPAALHRIMDGNPRIAALIRGKWVQVALVDPTSGAMNVWKDGAFEPQAPRAIELPCAATSREWYRGKRETVGFAAIEPARTSLEGEAA